MGGNIFPLAVIAFIQQVHDAGGGVIAAITSNL